MDYQVINFIGVIILFITLFFVRNSSSKINIKV